MFPQQVETVLKSKAPVTAAAPVASSPAAPVAATVRSNGASRRLFVTVNGQRHDVTVQTLEDNRASEFWRMSMHDKPPRDPSRFAWAPREPMREDPGLHQVGGFGSTIQSLTSIYECFTHSE